MHADATMNEAESASNRNTGRVVRSRRFGIAAILVAGLGLSLIMQSPGWAQSSYYALVRAMSNGTAEIDPYHWETKDKSWIDGKFYSVKAPGLPAAVLPAYMALDAAGFSDLSGRVGRKVIADGVREWYLHPAPMMNAGFDRARARALPVQVAEGQTMIWALGLIGSLLPAILIMLLVRRLADEIQPGTGAVSGLALGLGTLLLPFSVQLMGHLLSALMLFAAFLLLMRERHGPQKFGLVFAAGALAGLSVVVEYPIAFGGAAIGLYAMLRAGSSVAQALGRAASYGAGAVVGAIPVGLYNWWAFGSPATMSYSAAVAVQGRTGHEKLGLNDKGFFGIGVPKPANLLELLLAPRGLLTCTPVVLAAIFGVVLMHRDGRKAEARTVLGIAALYLIYVSGYWLPFGGGTPGPRFLIPAIPFLGLGLPYAWRRIPATTLVLALAGATVMTAATITFPLTGADGIWRWWRRITHGHFQQTVFTAMGMGDGYRAILPTVLLLGLACLLAAIATYGIDFKRDVVIAIASLAGWLAVVNLFSANLNEHAGDLVLKAVKLPTQLTFAAAGIAVAGLLVALVASRRSAPGAQLIE